jgi:hypothetical protein
MKQLKISLLPIVFCFLSLFIPGIYAQNQPNTSNHNDSLAVNELTVYVMPTMYPLDWTSPSGLYKSMKSCYIKTATLPDNYLLGHLAVKFKTSYNGKTRLLAMTAADKLERINLVIKEKIGFGILGYPLKGKFEDEKQLGSRLGIYAKRNKLAYIRYSLSEKAARRISDFIDGMAQKKKDQLAACDFYGGIFWPRYANEGSGCSAFGMALLDAAGLLPDESDEWLVKVNIPMNIIGGDLNNGKKIKNSTIKKQTDWNDGSGIKNVDFVPFQIYEPSIIFDWVLQKRNENLKEYIPEESNGVPGLYCDLRNVETSDNDSLFIYRPDKNAFTDYYFKNIRSLE